MKPNLASNLTRDRGITINVKKIELDDALELKDMICSSCVYKIKMTKAFCVASLDIKKDI